MFQVAGHGTDDFVSGGGEGFDEPKSRERTGAGEEDFHKVGVI
jgi:hypothetical protein